MLKRIGVSIALIAALAMTTVAFAQSPANIPLPTTRTRISFEPGTSAYTLTAYLVSGVSQGYVLRVAAGQKIYITKAGVASVEVLDPHDAVLTGPSTLPGPWGFWTTSSGDYTVVISGDGLAVLTVYIPPIGTGSQLPVPLSLYPERIRFVPGSTGYHFSTNLLQGQPAAFVLGIAALQQLTVSTQGNVTVAVLDPQENALLPVSPIPAQWRFGIPRTGDYTLVLLGSGTVVVNITIPPLGGPLSPPPPAAQRITFAPGTDSLTITPNLDAGTGQAYVLRIARGQVLYIFSSEGTAFEVNDPEYNRIGYSTSGGSFNFNIYQGGDYTVTFHGQGPASITFRIPALPGGF